jgi:hypothetical protein
MVNATLVTKLALLDVTSKFYHLCDDLKHSSQDTVSRMVIVFVCEDEGDGNKKIGNSSKGCGYGKMEDSAEGFIIR